MDKITEKQLIDQLRTLKDIKPRQEWAVLLKSQILSESKPEEVFVQKVGNWEIGKFIESWKLVIENSFSRRLAYSFATLLFMIVGVFGFAQLTVPGDLLFPVKKLAEQSQASLIGQPKIKQDVATLNSRINDLAQVAKAGRTDSMPSAISEINANVKDLAKRLKDNPTQDAQTFKDIAISLKTLADVPGTDLSANPDVENLYQTVVQSQIADLEKTTLTDEQKIILEKVKGLYDNEKYADALEEILLISK